MSGFWDRKIRTYFRRTDWNGDGELTREDFELMAERFAEGEGAGSKRRHQVKETFLQIFDTYEKNIGMNGKITEDRLVETLKELRCNPQFPKMLEDHLRDCFCLLDTDGDGYIEEDEYVRFFYNFRIPDHERLAKIAFTALDTDHDGRLSMEETVAGYRDFLLSEDESRPGTHFFGPLL